MESKAKITTGLNDRPRNETIGQTGEGIPDDSGTPLETSEAEIARTKAKLGLAPDTAAEVEKETDLPRKNSA